MLCAIYSQPLRQRITSCVAIRSTAKTGGDLFRLRLLVCRGSIGLGYSLSTPFVHR